jgi:hypothetical protein
MADNNPEVLHVIDVPLAFYQWLATVEKDVRVHDLTPHEIAGLQTALRAPAVSEEAGLIERSAFNDMANFAADERDRTILLSGLLEEARWYVNDSLEAHEHSDGRDLLGRIDTALSPTTPTEEPQS